MTNVTDLVKKSAPEAAELSFARSDVERSFGFPAGPHTTPGPLMVPLGAVMLTVAFYAVLWLARESYFAAMFTQRGVVPYVIALFGAWSFMILLVKSRKLKLQRKALAIRLLPEDEPGFVLTPESVEQILTRVYTAVDDPAKFLLTRRIHRALSNLKNMGRIGDVDEVLATQADNDEAQIDSSYTVLRGLIWAIPVMGFIGTVLGLSQALGAFGSVLAGAGQLEELKVALQSVTGGLSTAFETTLIGLVAALCIHMLMVFVRRREETFLDDCKDYCQKHIVGRLRLTSP